MAADPEQVEVTAHRGFSGVHPESTRAAYTAAIDVARRTGYPLQLEADVQLSRDGELVVLHDAELDRTALRPGRVDQLDLAELRTLDLGRWRLGEDATADQRRLVTLAELLDLVAAALAEGVSVGAAVEVKTVTGEDGPARTLDVVDRVLVELDRRGWTQTGSPVRMIAFSPAVVHRVARRAPALRRSHLVARWSDLPPTTPSEGVDTLGLAVALAEADPERVQQLIGGGTAVHLWTLDDPATIRRWLAAGVTGITSDHCDVALAAVHHDPEDPTVR